MTTLKIATYDALTNEYSERDMTPEEILEHEKMVSEELARQAELDAKLIAKSALLERLGITSDEAKLLLS